MVMKFSEGQFEKLQTKYGKTPSWAFWTGSLISEDEKYDKAIETFGDNLADLNPAVVFLGVSAGAKRKDKDSQQNKDWIF